MCLKRLLLNAVDYPPILDRVRWLIEAGHRGEKRVIRRELVDKNGMVLDVPCGTGTFSPLFSDEEYSGVDLGEKYVKRA